MTTTSEFQDHGTEATDCVKVVIRKDEWISSRPWFADLVFADGTVWKDWQSFFRTKKRLIENVRAAAPKAKIIDA